MNNNDTNNTNATVEDSVNNTDSNTIATVKPAANPAEQAPIKDIPVSTASQADPALTAIYEKLRQYKIDDATIDNVITELGAEDLAEFETLEFEDLTSAGIPTAKARKIISDRKAAQAAPIPAKTVEGRGLQNQYEILPNVPNDESWLCTLKSGGILKVDDSTYIATIRAALADRVGLYDIPKALVTAMEEQAKVAEDPIDPIFFKIRRNLTRRTYGDIFEAIEGLDGSYITDARRKEFLTRVNDILWPALRESYQTLDAWYQTWQGNMANPTAIMGLIQGINTGVNMIPSPEMDSLHAAGEALVNAINRLFAGTGVQVAAAMAYEANSIRTTLEDPRLPAMIGVSNREMMLKKIHANVSSDYVRLEQNVVRYVLAFVKYNNITSDVEQNYYMTLWQLGKQINWDNLNHIKNDVHSLTGEELL